MKVSKKKKKKKR